jgi:hypothetical protein
MIAWPLWSNKYEIYKILMIAMTIFFPKSKKSVMEIVFLHGDLKNEIFTDNTFDIEIDED